MSVIVIYIKKNKKNSTYTFNVLLCLIDSELLIKQKREEKCQFEGKILYNEIIRYKFNKNRIDIRMF